MLPLVAISLLWDGLCLSLVLVSSTPRKNTLYQCVDVLDSVISYDHSSPNICMACGCARMFINSHAVVVL